MLTLFVLESHFHICRSVIFWHNFLVYFKAFNVVWNVSNFYIELFEPSLKRDQQAQWNVNGGTKRHLRRTINLCFVLAFLRLTPKRFEKAILSKNLHCRAETRKYKAEVDNSPKVPFRAYVILTFKRQLV